MAYIYENTLADGTKAGLWEPEIYRLQTSDPIMGGEDGQVNVQPRQLANRTRWLLYTFLKEHGADGKHTVVDSMVADDAAISESKVTLDKSCAELRTQSDSNNEVMDELSTSLQKVLGSDGLLIFGITKMLQLLGKYYKYKYSFEIFCDSITMRDFADHHVTCTAGSDDTLISRESISDLQAGTSLLLFDDDKSEEVVLESLLDYDHIRTRDDLQYSYDEATLGHTNWTIESGSALVAKGQTYLSNDLDNLVNYSSGLLVIRRDSGVGAVEVYWRGAADHGDWERVYPESRYLISSGTIDEYYYIDGWRSVQFKVVGAKEDPFRIYHMAFLPVYANRKVATIRKPEIYYPEKNSYVGKDEFYLQASEYLNIYRDPYSKTEYRLINPYTDEVAALYTASTADTAYVAEENVPEEGQYLLQARHVSDLGDASEWSSAIFITIGEGKTWFGFEGAKRAGSFDIDPLKGLENQVVFFGFFGCPKSGGFGNSQFVYKKSE